MLGWVALAWGGEVFALGGDVSATARYIDHLELSDPSEWGASAAVRAELDVRLMARVELRYVEEALFGQDQPRFFDLSAAVSSPALIFLCADVHEVFVRASSRAEDGLAYVLPGIGLKGRLGPVVLKGTVGVSWVGGPGQDALGGFAGVDLVFRTAWVDVSGRGALTAVADGGRLYAGMLLDGDVAIKVPVGRAWLGPRLDVAYRNLGLNPDEAALFGLQHDLGAHLGLAVGWGTGRRPKEAEVEEGGEE